jgi:tRNA dimethylallyltransferase
MPVQNKPAVIAIVGPTCTGKTDLSIELAQKLNGEIIALDSRTVYKKMDIGTAKPTIKQQNAIKHHALDLTEPDHFFTVAEYVKAANKAIEAIISLGKLPILCGGTGLYARALLEGIQIPAIAPQEELRTELNKLAEEKGNQELHSKLANLDPMSAARISINDRRRIIRALEVTITSGQPFSQLATQGKPPYETTWIGLTWNNRRLHKDLITERLSKQLKEGLLDEVKTLWNNPNYQAVLNNSVNYKEFIAHLNGLQSLDEACQICVKSNFQLARKQMIWFRARKYINWLAIDELSKQECFNKAFKMLPAYFLH